jgi:hypothetical protein
VRDSDVALALLTRLLLADQPDGIVQLGDEPDGDGHYELFVDVALADLTAEEAELVRTIRAGRPSGGNVWSSDVVIASEDG